MNHIIDENNSQFTVTAQYTDNKEILYSVHNEEGELVEHVFSRFRYTKVAIFRKPIRTALSTTENMLHEITVARDDLEQHLNEDDDRRTDEYEEILEAQLHDFEIQIASLQKSIAKYNQKLSSGQIWKNVRIAFYEAKDTSFAVEAESFQDHPSHRIVVLKVPAPVALEYQQAA